MNTNILSVRFFVKKYRAKNNRVPIYVRILLNGKYVDVSLKRDIDLDSWSMEQGQAKGNRPEIKALNSQLEQVRAEITHAYNTLKFEHKALSAEAVKNKFCGVDADEQTLFGLMEYHNNNLKQFLKWGTMKNYFTTKKYVKKILNETMKVNDIPLSQLSYKFLVDYQLFLMNLKPKDHRKPCGHNTALKHIERLRKLINLAIKNEWIDRDPFVKFQARFVRTERGFLTAEELNSIETKDIKIFRLEWARDMFVFSCYTGLAYSDARDLAPSDISLGIDGDYWIVILRTKTNQSVRVPLLPKALQLVEKYKNHPRALAMGTVFPLLTNQKLNAYLKEIADLCGITKNLTFHLARHTFATTVTLTNGVPIETVSRMLGHTSIRTTQVYAKVIEKKISTDMTELKKKLALQSRQAPFIE